MSKKKVLLRGVFINRDTNGEGVLKVGTTLIRVSTVMGILYIQHLTNSHLLTMYLLQKRIMEELGMKITSVLQTTTLMVEQTLIIEEMMMLTLR